MLGSQGDLENRSREEQPLRGDAAGVTPPGVEQASLSPSVILRAEKQTHEGKYHPINIHESRLQRKRWKTFRGDEEETRGGDDACLRAAADLQASCAASDVNNRGFVSETRKQKHNFIWRPCHMLITTRPPAGSHRPSRLTVSGRIPVKPTSSSGFPSGWLFLHQDRGQTQGSGRCKQK